VVIIHNGPPSRVIPAYGATVTLGTLTGKTDAKGFSRFATVKPGQYQVTASLPPYAAAPKVVVVKGGGVTGQTDSVVLGMARALIKMNPDYHGAMRKGGFLTRDARVKERKKPGLKRARKAPTYTKR